MTKPVDCALPGCSNTYKNVRSMRSHWNNKKTGHTNEHGPLTAAQVTTAKAQEAAAAAGGGMGGAGSPHVSVFFAPSASSSSSSSSSVNPARPLASSSFPEFEEFEDLDEAMSAHVAGNVPSGKQDVDELSSSSSSSSSVAARSNPATALLTSISENDFQGCRTTSDGLISIHDAIKYSRPGCNPHDVYKNLDVEKFLNQSEFRLVQEFRFSSRHNPIPVAPFNVVNRILMEVGGDFGDALKSAANEVHTRAMTDDIPSGKQDVDELSSSSSVVSLDRANNLLDRLFGTTKQLTERLKDCTTADGWIGINKAIAAFIPGCNINDAGEKFRNLGNSGKSPEFSILKEFIQKKSFGHKKTRVCRFSVLLRILAMLPGAQSNALRAIMAEITTRVMAGDVDLLHAIQQRRAEIPPELEQLLMGGLKRSRGAQDALQSQLIRSKKQKLSLQNEVGTLRIKMSLESINTGIEISGLKGMVSKLTRQAEMATQHARDQEANLALSKAEVEALTEEVNRAAADVLQMEDDIAGSQSQTRSSRAQAADELEEARARAAELSCNLEAAKEARDSADIQLTEANNRARTAETAVEQERQQKQAAVKAMQEAEQATQEAEQATQEAEQATQEAEQATQEAEQATQDADEQKLEAEQAKKVADEQKLEAEQAKNVADEQKLEAEKATLAAEQASEMAVKGWDQALEATQLAVSGKNEAVNEKNLAVQKVEEEKKKVDDLLMAMGGQKGQIERLNSSLTTLKAQLAVVVHRLCQVDSSGKSSSFPLRFPCVQGLNTSVAGIDDERVRELIGNTWRNVGRVIVDAAKLLHYSSTALRETTAAIMDVSGCQDIQVNRYLDLLRPNNNVTQKSCMQGIFKVRHPGHKYSTNTDLYLLLPYLHNVNDFLSGNDCTKHMVLAQVQDLEGVCRPHRVTQQAQAQITDYFMH